MNSFIDTTRCTVVLILLAATIAQPTIGAEKPNIIFILVDDMGWGDPGCYPTLRPEDGPEAMVATPNIDRLAASGVRFTNGYANHMVCAPTRAGLLTGRYQHRIGYYGFEETTAPFPSVVMLPEPLRAAGYATGLMGKWHISYSSGSRPLDRGFERFFGFLGGQHDYFDPDVGQPPPISGCGEEAKKQRGGQGSDE